jgi:2-polyprenyl-3-methyl-5-hydroxy-6-metoxy-1,4-benzoquinol methylase
MIQQPSLPPQQEQIEALSANELTLRSYEQGTQEYISGTAAEVSGQTKVWIDRTLALLPKQARIIEIGSAFGRDSHYIESCGFSVERTDATHSFVTLLQGQGYSAHAFNIIRDAFNGTYDMIFANAVFLHFTAEEFEKVITKTHEALNSNGILSFSVKKGEGQEWSSAKINRPRYYCYWTPDALMEKLESAGFTILYTAEDGIFIQIIARKNDPVP